MNTRRVSVDWLTSVLAKTFRSVGFSEVGAEAIAISLVKADARGVHSHGVMLAPLYVDRVRAGVLLTHDSGEVVTETTAMAVIDAQNGAGQIIGRQAMKLAVEKARSAGVAAVSVRHSNHFGAGAVYVEQAAAEGCIGIAMSNTTPLMPAPGGAMAVVGNNPLAVGIPRKDLNPPVVLDMALSAAAGGKVRYHAQAGMKIPDTWAVDAEGMPTTDPNEALKGFLLPFGGYKGYGLAVIVDLLTGALSGGATSTRVQSLYKNMEAPNDCSQLFLAFDVSAFGTAEGFATSVETMIKSIHSAPRAEGTERVYLPGEKEDELAIDARENGIQVETAVVDALLETAKSLGVDVGAAVHGNRYAS